MDVLAERCIPGDPDTQRHTYFIFILFLVNLCMICSVCVSHHGCLRACSHVKRLAGSFSIRLPMKSLAGREKHQKCHHLMVGVTYSNIWGTVLNTKHNRGWCAILGMIGQFMLVFKWLTEMKSVTTSLQNEWKQTLNQNIHKWDLFKK